MRRRFALGLAAGLLLAACASEDPDSPGSRVLLPEGSGAAPVVVLVPGGGWSSADPSGLRPLAERLRQDGSVTATTTYRTSADGARFPAPVEDVLCAAATVVSEAKEAGRSGGPVVLVGHSAGGHLAVLAGLRPESFRGECDAPPVVPDAVVGLAGAYDVRQLAGVAEHLFGVPEADDPELWRQGDLLSWTHERPELPVLLVHGEADAVVPVEMSRRLAKALTDSGHDVDLQTVPGVDHLQVFDAEVVASRIRTWLQGLPPP